MRVIVVDEGDGALRVVLIPEPGNAIDQAVVALSGEPRVTVEMSRQGYSQLSGRVKTEAAVVLTLKKDTSVQTIGQPPAARG